MKDGRVFMFGGYDCEPLSHTSSCGGPLTWEESEAKVLQIAGLYKERGLLPACSFELTPAAAQAQPDLYLSLRAEGAHIGIQPNIPGFRYPRYDRDLGLYSEQEQREILALAKQEFEEALGFSTTCYTACCGSRSDATIGILIDLGYREYRPPGPGRASPQRPDRTTAGMFPWPSRASRTHRCLSGCSEMIYLPITADILEQHSSRGHTGDLRGERPVGEKTRAIYRDIIDTHLELFEIIEPPVKLLQPMGHNTRFCEGENVAYVLDYILQKVPERGFELAPISPTALRELIEAEGLL